MNDLFVINKFGQTRIAHRYFKKGETCNFYPGQESITFKEDVVVDVVEKYHQQKTYISGDDPGVWRLEGYKWDTLRAKDSPVPLPEPEPEPEPAPGFWARLFKRNKLPKARIVCR